MNVGDVVVHKSMGSQPLVVKAIQEDGTISARYCTQGQHGVYFTTEDFHPEELETPVESIEREGEIFRTLNTKKKEIETEIHEPTGKLIPIN